MTKIGLYEFEVGQLVSVLENDEIIDEGILKRIESGGNTERDEIDLESQKFDPGIMKELASFRHYDESKAGWRLLFKDPMTGRRCYSEYAPLYVLKPL